VSLMTGTISYLACLPQVSLAAGSKSPLALIWFLYLISRISHFNWHEVMCLLGLSGVQSSRYMAQHQLYTYDHLILLLLQLCVCCSTAYYWLVLLGQASLASKESVSLTLTELNAWQSLIDLVVSLTA